MTERTPFWMGGKGFDGMKAWMDALTLSSRGSWRKALHKVHVTDDGKGRPDCHSFRHGLPASSHAVNAECQCRAGARRGAVALPLDGEDFGRLSGARGGGLLQLPRAGVARGASVYDQVAPARDACAGRSLRSGAKRGGAAERRVVF